MMPPVVKPDSNAILKSVVEDPTVVLTLAECIAIISGRRGLHALLPWTYRLANYPTRGIARLGILPLSFCDGPKGVNLGRATCFPVAIARGASWDAQLEEKIGEALGKEAAAQGVNALGSVCLNIIRHPCWGRAQETFSADPVLMTAMGVALMQGIQSQNVMAVIKHFACNSIENSRFRVSVNIDTRALHEIYLPHFKACVEAGAAGVMSAYNRLNGEFCGENNFLLTEILRHRWGFSGFVLSDFFFGARSTAKTMRAGVDLEMPQTWHYSRRRILRAIKNRQLHKADVRQAAARVLRQLTRFGYTGDRQSTPPKSVIACDAHQQLALESARQSIVLLKNDDLLPLTGMRSLAVIGKLANKANLGSEGSASVKPPFSITLAQGLRQQFSNTELYFDNGHNSVRAAALAAKCDAVILTTGLRGSDEGEYFLALAGGDRQKLELEDRQIKLIDAVVQANPNTAVVMFGGSAIACGDWRHKVKALVMAWYPGMCGGLAIAEILCGSINPCGRLPLSFPVKSEDMPPFDSQANQVSYDLWHDYRWLLRNRITPAYAFGHGLGYSRFEYQEFSAQLQGETIELSIKLANAGSFDGTELVQVYLAGDAPGGERAVFELKQFCRVTLGVCLTKTVSLQLPVQKLAWFDPERDDWVLEAGSYRLFCGTSVDNLLLEASVDVLVPS